MCAIWAVMLRCTLTLTLGAPHHGMPLASKLVLLLVLVFVLGVIISAMDLVDSTTGMVSTKVSMMVSAPGSY